MKAKWIALLARRIRNGARSEIQTTALLAVKELSEHSCVQITYIAVGIMISFGDTIFILRIADCEASGILSKSPSWQKPECRIADGEKVEGGMLVISRAEDFKPRRAYIKKQESDLLIRWIAPHHAVSDAKKEYRRRRKERRGLRFSICRPDTSQVIAFWFSLESCIMPTMPRCTELSSNRGFTVNSRGWRDWRLYEWRTQWRGRKRTSAIAT